MLNRYCGKTLNSSFSVFKQTGRRSGTVEFWWCLKFVQNGRTQFLYSYSFAEVRLFLPVCWMYKWSMMEIPASPQSIQKHSTQCCVLNSRLKRLLGCFPKKRKLENYHCLQSVAAQAGCPLSLKQLIWEVFLFYGLRNLKGWQINKVPGCSQCHKFVQLIASLCLNVAASQRDRNFW